VFIKMIYIFLFQSSSVPIQSSLIQLNSMKFI